MEDLAKLERIWAIVDDKEAGDADDQACHGWGGGLGIESRYFMRDFLKGESS